MDIKTFKAYFFKELDSIYPQAEIGSFFTIFASRYLQMNRAEVALDPLKLITTEQENQLMPALEQLKKHIPVQYIIGETEFFSLPFNVNPAVLIPRPETEELVEWIINDIKNQFAKKPITILDIGTGSGCIAVSLAKNLKNANVTALDISQKALETAKKNAELNNVTVTFQQQDILEISDLPEKWGVIVSNPPYICEKEKASMEKNVLENEPPGALFVPDADPLLFYKKIAFLASKSLVSGGNLYLEINEAFGKETVLLLKETGFKDVELKKDFFGKDRMVKATF